VEASALDVFVMNRDGSNMRQVTKGLGGSNWAPFFAPDGTKIIFASNMKNPRGGNFDLYLINVDGTAWSRSPSATRSTASRCSRRTARS
jgi:Tol biopolymer transport system component